MPNTLTIKVSEQRFNLLTLNLMASIVETQGFIDPCYNNEISQFWFNVHYLELWPMTRIEHMVESLNL